MSELTEIFPLGFGASAGLHYGGRSDAPWGLGASLFVRAIVDVRAGLDYNFGEVGWSVHIGLIDPHLLVAAIVKIARD